MELLDVKCHNEEKIGMSRSNDHSNGPVESNGLPWMLTSLVAVIIISFLLPFPISFLVSLIVIFSLAIIRAYMVWKKMGTAGIKGWPKSFSSLQPSNRWGGDTYRPLTFYCMLCGYPHNKIACPKCGSKAVRVS
jgi:ribosomal protein L37E